jgi:hypothetical protein
MPVQFGRVLCGCFLNTEWVWQYETIQWVVEVMMITTPTKISGTTTIMLLSFIVL